MKVKSESKVAQLCLTLSDPMDCSLPGSSAHGIFQVRVLECSIIKIMDLDVCDKDGIWGNYAKWNKSHRKKILYNFTRI